MAKQREQTRQQSKSRGLRGRSNGIADWTTATPSILIDAISSAAISGGALRFGYSRDGGAYALGIYGDGEPYTEFCKPSEDLDAFLLDVKELFDDIRDDQMSTRRSTNNPPSGDST